MTGSRYKILAKQSLPVIIAMLSFAVLITGSTIFNNYKKAIFENDLKTRLHEILMIKKSKMEKALYSRIHYPRSIAAYVSVNPDITSGEFYDLAQQLIKNDSIISSMALSKNCIINAIYPLKGHEAAIGLNLLSHPERKDIVEKTIQTHKTFTAGPVELIEGGIAFISYTPIFSKTTADTNNFWGVTDIVFKQDMLLEQANLKESESGFLFALRGYNGQGNDGAIWWGDEQVFEQNPLTINITLPYGTWVLAAIPELGWSTYFNQDKTIHILLVFSSFIISILIWLISRSFVKIVKSEQNLKEVVATKDKFFSIIAHDLRSPFNILLGFSDLLETRYEYLDEAQRKKFIIEINKSSKITLELIENLLLWAKSQSNKISIVKNDLNAKDLIGEAITVNMPNAKKKNISVEISVSEDLIVYADEFTIKTVIGNLFNNAIKFTHKNGEIKISAFQKENFIEVSISDNGIGIPPDILSKLFRIEENVSRLGTEKEKGTGLGLMLCKEFIDGHNGSIWVESDPNIDGKEVSTTFYFTLPYSD